MYGFDKIKVGVLVLFIVLLVVLYIDTSKNENNPKIDDSVNNYDDNAVVTRKELRESLLHRPSKPLTTQIIQRSVLSGALRGGLLGFLVNGVEGAVVGAMVLGSVNPLIAKIELMI